MSTPSPPSQPPPPKQQLNLLSLPTPQLTNLKNTLTTELQHLTTSYSQLKSAQSKFQDCIVSVREGVREAATPLLIPLTPSLYVPGLLASTTTLLVDIGTGFYVEKTPGEAVGFYKNKVAEIGGNLGDLEKIVKGKQGGLGVVEDVLRQKVIAESGKGGEGGT